MIRDIQDAGIPSVNIDSVFKRLVTNGNKEPFQKGDEFAESNISIIKQLGNLLEGKIDQEESENKFTYMMLGRLKDDCEYFLGNGHGNPKVLHQLNVKDQIKEMKRLWNELPEDEKPEWLSMEDIQDYEKRMSEVKESAIKEALIKGMPKEEEQIYNKFFDYAVKYLEKEKLDREKSLEKGIIKSYDPAMVFLGSLMNLIINGFEETLNKEELSEWKNIVYGYNATGNRYVPNLTKKAFKKVHGEEVLQRALDNNKKRR
jgi:hypothetical protein